LKIIATIILIKKKLVDLINVNRNTMRKKKLIFGFAVSMLFATSASFGSFITKDMKRVDSAVTNEPANQAIQESLKEFNSLSRHEKRSRIKEIKKAIKEYRAQKKDETDVSTNTLLLVIIAILIPPLAVYIHEGDINNRFWISVLLTVLGYFLFSFAGILFLGSLPGIIYALYVILSGT